MHSMKTFLVFREILEWSPKRQREHIGFVNTFLKQVACVHPVCVRVGCVLTVDNGRHREDNAIAVIDDRV